MTRARYVNGIISDSAYDDIVKKIEKPAFVSQGCIKKKKKKKKKKNG